MLRYVRNVFRWLTSLLFAAIVVQVGLAGYGAFNAVHKAEKAEATKKVVESGFNAHIALGYIIVLVMLLMLIVAAVGKLGSASVKFSGALVILGILQAVLGMISESTPAIGPLHTINALAIYAVSALLAHKAWTQHRSSQPVATPA
ncbi:MAG: hypothetical protein ACRDK2_00635 [Solirubrobacteraceae bacterium]